MAFIFLFFLVNSAKKSQDRNKMIGNCTFGGSLLLMFCTSTIYHALNYSYLKRWFRVFDHISIYILIAGCYTPFTLTYLRQSRGKLINIIVWSIAAFGSSMKILFFDAFDPYSMQLFYIMGFIFLVSAKELITKLSKGAIFYFVLGGLMYIIGSYFYNSYTIYWHAIWHVFVVLGGFFHSICVCFYL